MAKRHWSIRISEADFNAAKQLAAEHGLTPTEYTVRAITGRLHPEGLEQRVDELQQRLERVEQIQSLTC